MQFDHGHEGATEHQPRRALLRRQVVLIVEVVRIRLAVLKPVPRRAAEQRRAGRFDGWDAAAGWAAEGPPVVAALLGGAGPGR